MPMAEDRLMRWYVWIGFGALCLLSASIWLIPPSASDSLPALERQGLLYGVIGVVGLAWASGRIWDRRRWRLVVASVAFFGVPSVFLEWGAGSVSGVLRSAVFAVVPVVVVVLAAASLRGEAGVRRLLAPALAGFGGVLLLLPVGLPGSARGRWMLSGLVLVAILVAVSGIWMYRLLQGVRLAEAIAVVGVSNGVFLMVCSLGGASLMWRWSDLASIISIGSLIDLSEVFLLVWLLGAMMPVRFAARYLVIPLLTVAEGYVLLRPSLTARMGFGAVLVAAGIWMILSFKTGEEETVLSLR